MKPLTPLFQAVIAFVAVLTGLGFVFNLILSPVKTSQANLEKRMDKLEAGQDELKAKLDQLINDLIQKKDTHKKAVLAIPKAQ